MASPMLVCKPKSRKLAVPFILENCLTSVSTDFCSGGSSKVPEQTVTEIIVERGFNDADLYYTATRFYVTQCQTTNPFSFLDTYSSELIDASTTLQALTDSLTTTKLADLTTACGSSVEGIDSMVSTMQEDIKELESELDSAFALLKCDKVVPLFTSVVYDAACTDAVHSFYYGWVGKCAS